MNPTAIYSKSGKGVQEASGKTSLLKRPDRAVLSAIDGRATLADVAQKVGRAYDGSFQTLIAQLDRDGFIRAVTAGTAAASVAAPSRPAAPPSKPGARPAPKPSAPADAATDLDFSSLGATKPAARPAVPPPRPAAPAPSAHATAQQSALDKAREEAEARAAADRERLKKEAEDRTRSELEAKLRAEAEKKLKEEAEAKAKDDAEAKVKAARDAAVRAAAEAKAKADAERRAREELERRLEEERRAREEAERKAKEEAERMRQALEAERKRLEEERRRDEEDRATLRKQREQEEALAAAAIAAATVDAPKEAPKAANFSDSLLADLESFTKRDDEEAKAREESEREAKAQAQRKRADAERRAREDTEREEAEARRREEEEARQKEEEQRRAREEEERLAREEERRKREAEEIRRKAEAATAAALAKQGEVQFADIPISDDDLDMDEVANERKALFVDQRKEREAKRDAERRKREEEKKKRDEEKRAAKAAKTTSAAYSRGRHSSHWGRRIALIVIVLLVLELGAAHVIPLDTAQYERNAAQAIGQPVKIGAAHLWLFTGVQVRLDDVRVGDARIAQVVTHPALGSLFGEKKHFSQIDLHGVKVPQEALGQVLFMKVKSENFSVERIRAQPLELPGPLALPKDLDAEIALDARGAVRTVSVRGPDGLFARLTPKGSNVEFDVVAGGFPLPMAPQVVLSNFAMKGAASRQGMNIAEWGGALFNGGISGTANVRWTTSWHVEGVLTVRNINAAVFAPALLSEGKAEGTGKFSLSAADPSRLFSAGRMEGNFTVSKGVLGSFDLSRAIQTRGKQAFGRTQFAQMNGQAIYDRGAVALRNVTIGAGALNAGASADIAQSGALSGRIVADVRNAGQTLSATLLLGGTVKEPQVRN